MSTSNDHRHDAGRSAELVEAIRPLLRDGVVAHVVDADLLILDPDANEVVRVAGAHASVGDVVAALDGHGMLSSAESLAAGSPQLVLTSAMSRRQMLQGAVAVGVVGVTVLALPAAAMAASTLSAPTDVEASPGPELVTISWTSVPGATHYQVEFKASSEELFDKFGAPVAVSPVSVTGLTEGVEYEFRVVALRIVDGVTTGESAPSDSVNGIPSTALGLSWTGVVAAGLGEWTSVAGDGQGAWIAVAPNGDNRGMRSISDGESWLVLGVVDGVEQSGWRSVASNGIDLWVAVAESGVDRVMGGVNYGTSWSALVAPDSELSTWQSVATNGRGVWVAVANEGPNRLMRIVDDGETWTAVEVGAGVPANAWSSVAWGRDAFDGNGVWIAVADGGEGRIMRSTDDGMTWDVPVTFDDIDLSSWRSVASDGNGVWVAVADNGPNRVMRSDDHGATWYRPPGVFNDVEPSSWQSVASGGSAVGVWVAVADGGPNRVMRSVDDGETWSVEGISPGIAANPWRSVAYSNGRFVAVASDGAERVMFSPAPAP